VSLVICAAGPETNCQAVGELCARNVPMRADFMQIAQWHSGKYLCNPESIRVLHTRASRPHTLFAVLKEPLITECVRKIFAGHLFSSTAN
jgi:hypothetical protein